MNNIKVYDFLRLLESSYIIVWLKGEDEKPVFEGWSFDFPIGYANYYLSPDIENEYAFSLRENARKNGESAIVLCITE